MTDYVYYQEVYQGTMTKDEFSRLQEKAAAYVDAVTFGRVRDYGINNKVKNAVCAVADALLLNEHGGGVVSETVGKISRNYAAGISNTPTEEQRLNQAVSLYLSNTGLLYRGW